MSEENGLIPMPPGEIHYNGGYDPCDMKVGPCTCGAWHKEEYLEHFEIACDRELLMSYYKSVVAFINKGNCCLYADITGEPLGQILSTHTKLKKILKIND